MGKAARKFEGGGLGAGDWGLGAGEMGRGGRRKGECGRGKLGRKCELWIEGGVNVLLIDTTGILRGKKSFAGRRFLEMSLHRAARI